MKQEAEKSEKKIEFEDKFNLSNQKICEAKLVLLKLFDQICRENQIQYFAISNMLTSCVHYQKFIPGEAKREWDLGILRPDYERLLSLLRKYPFPPHIRLNEYLDSEKKRPREMPYLEIAVEIDNEEVCAKKVLHIRFLPFDKLPKGQDISAGFLDAVDKEAALFQEIVRWGDFKTAKSGLKEYAYKHIYYSRFKAKDQYKKAQALAASYQNDKEADSYGRIIFGKSKVIREDQLFPLKEMPFEDMMIPCPNDVTVWTPVFNEELEYQVKSIQKADMILLKRFDEVCRELGIGYFICGGTMLGYMRHGGFIPWDDDIDVAMLRADYNRFLAEAGPYFDDRFFIQTRESDPKIPYLFSKIRLNNTEYVTKYNEHRDYHKGLCLDIFPFDYLPNDKKERAAFVDHVVALSREHIKTASGQTPVPVNDPQPRDAKEKEYLLNAQKKRKHFNSISLKDTQAAYIKEATKYNAKAKEMGLKTVGSFVPSYTYIDMEDLLPYQDGDFNGIRVMVPKRPDIFLTMQYGDYMQLPPKHMQIAHKLIRWSTDLTKKEEN